MSNDPVRHSYMGLEPLLHQVGMLLEEFGADDQVCGDELARRLAAAIDAKKQFIWIARRLALESANKLDAMELKGIFSRKESKRYYPNDSLAAHVLGFVGAEQIKGRGWAGRGWRQLRL